MAPRSLFVSTEFDLEDAIARFAGDDSCNSHALPASLTLEERQLAKRLARRHPKLECESYGFGTERQLYLFKRLKSQGIAMDVDAAQVDEVRMRVKNTFIDAWLEDANSQSGELLVCRSLPADLREIAYVSVETEYAEYIQASMDCLVCSTPSPCMSPKVSDLPGTPLLMQACECSKETTELSQSPLLGTAPPPASPVMPPPVSPSNVALLPEGTEVEIDGLAKYPHFNGSAGVVKSWDGLMRRYDVLLDNSPGGVGRRLVKAKRENLRIRPPPPPHEAAPVSPVHFENCLNITGDDCTHLDTSLAVTMSPQNGNGIIHEEWPSWHLGEEISQSYGWSGNVCSLDEVNSPCSTEQFGVSDATWNNGFHYSDGSSPVACDGVGWLQQNSLMHAYH